MTGQNKLRIKRTGPVVFDMTSSQCLWSKAGVVASRPCHNAFDCMSCAFDKAIARKKRYGWLAGGLEEPGSEVWSRELWLSLPASERKCRHMLTGRVSVMYCDNAYDCSSCAYDQMLDAAEAAPVDREVELTPVAGFMLPHGYYLHPGHTWARVEYGGRVRVGLDDLAARLFGPPDHCKLPPLGRGLRGGGAEIAFDRDGHYARAICPVEGVVVARNPDVARQPSLVGQSPYARGWLLLIEPTRLVKDVKKLLIDEDAFEWMENEALRLADMITGDTGMRLAATGGRVVEDVYGSVPELSWERLAKEFLRAV